MGIYPCVLERLISKPQKELTDRQRNLRLVRRLRDVSQDDLDSQTGGKPGRTYSYEKGVAHPPKEFLRAAAKILEVSPDVFDMPDILGGGIGSGEGTVAVPYWGVVPCGDWEPPHGDPETIQITGKVRGFDGVIAVRIGGESMAPILKPGDVVPVRLTKRPNDGAIALVRNESNDLTIKITRFRGRWEFHPLNPRFEKVTSERIEMIGKVLQIPERFDPDGITI